MSKMSKSLKRKPKNTPVPKPEINLSTALPDSNDFRTSLLMPQLSARFSMLREQDDPNTKVGKANDDSVLFPKRASRLNLFTHNPLTDIAEVESIHTTIRPPFARADRSYSMSEGYASDDGASTMSRSKPGEGNNLFGGRQKMYRVLAGSESNKTLTGGQPRASGMGKHVYEDDVSMSSYQRYRSQSHDDERPDVLGMDEPEENDAMGSPLTAFSKNRGTTSSTTSGPSNRRTSTAATSVTSESPIPRQNSHGFGKQRTSDSVNGSDESLVRRIPSSDSRKNFALRDGSAQPPVPLLQKTVSQSRSAVNLNDKYSRGGVFASNAFRAVSPPPMTNAPVIGSLDIGMQDANYRVASPTRRYQTSSPSSPSPIEDDGDHVYSNNLQPNDRGKATAMGLFNRPQQQFDEQQFLQRQRQMFEGRQSPLTAESRSESRASPDITRGAMSRIDAALAGNRNQTPSSLASSLQTKSIRNNNSPHKADATASLSSNQPQRAAGAETVDVKARVESLIRRQNAELAALEEERNVVQERPTHRKASQGSETLAQPSSGTFFNNFDASDDEVDLSPQRDSRPRMAHSDIHPALRDGTHDFDFGETVSNTPRITYRESHVSNKSNSRQLNGIDTVRDSAQHPSQVHGDDSPTLGPNGLGLSGMIRSHLRHDSDKSSIYPPSPAVSSFPHREVSMASTTHTINPPESVHSDPWEFDSVSRNQKSQTNSDATPTMSQKAQQILGQAEAQSKAQRILGHEAPKSAREQKLMHHWQDELAAHHRRGESTETQKERQDFDNELAERQRRIQERLKGATEEAMRSASPMGRQGYPFAQQKPNVGNMGPPSRPDGQPKAMKMLGLGSQEDISMRSPKSARNYDADQYYDRSGHGHQPAQRPPPPVEPNFRNGRRTPAEGRPPMDAPYGNGRRTPAEGRPMDPYSNGRRTPAEGRPPMDGAYGNGRRTPAEGRNGYPNSSNEDFERQRQRSATPNSGRPRRDRANSNAVRNDGYGYPPEHRQGQSPSPPDTRSRRGAPTPDLYDRSPSATGSRQRNGSRPPHPGPGYFDNRDGPSPTPMGIPGTGAPPRPSPRPPFPPSPMSPFGAPGAPPPSGPAPSPFTDGRSTANNQTRTGRDRKKSVTRGMISEPMFVSSTSSVPLVDLPGGIPGPRPMPLPSPPVPAMNPRRRGTNDLAASASVYGGSHSAQPSPSLPMSPLPPTENQGHPHPSQYTTQQSQYSYASADNLISHPHPHSNLNTTSHSHPSQYADASKPTNPPPRARNRLRKISSEGGNMASRARQQAFMTELGKEKESSPRVPMFPNRSTTSLGMGAGVAAGGGGGNGMSERDGGMF